jgi:hypothetical protein
MVEDEDGFEIPSLIKECVVVGDVETQAHSSRRSPLPAAELVKPTPAPAPKPAPASKPTETAEGERLSLYLAYLPLEPNNLIKNKGFEAYFINDSNYSLFINYMSRENNSWRSRYNGIVEPNMQIFLEEIPNEELSSMERVCLQAVAFKEDKPYSMKNAISVEMRIDTVKFYKPHCFMDNEFFDEGAIIYPVMKQDVPEREMQISASAIKDAMVSKGDAPVKKANQPKTVIKDTGAILEIDLHINQLLDSTAGLSNSDMLRYQLDKFDQVMRQFEKEKGKKIVFIHGKGDGVLRKAIEKELKTKYKQHYFQDASFREYGFGATMVTIR